MVKINTNLQSSIVQNNLAKSTTALNRAIERMTTGFKINHASDNAANYAIASSMESKLSSLDVASDNVATGIDLIQTATDNLDLVNSHLTRIRDLMEQSANGTYGEESRRAVQAEVDSRLDEINRIVANCEFNGIQIFNSGILPSAAKISLTDFGMSAGSIDFNVNGNTRTVNLTENDTLFSLMTKMDTIGVKSNFEDSTGMFTVNLNASDVTDNGTNFKSILGLEDTDGYRTDVMEEDVQKTSKEVAQLTTRLDAVGITNGSFTIVDSIGGQTNDSISVTSTIQDLFDKLATYDITGSLDENGVITLDTDGNYLKGALATQLGINYTETTHNEYEGITTNTSNSLTYTTASGVANNDTKLYQLGIAVGDTLYINNNDGTVADTITADESFVNSSIGDLLTTLGSYFTSATMTDGVIALTSDDNKYITGTIATKMGIGVNTTTTSTTAGITTTIASATYITIPTLITGTVASAQTVNTPSYSNSDIYAFTNTVEQIDLTGYGYYDNWYCDEMGDHMVIRTAAELTDFLTHRAPCDVILDADIDMSNVELSDERSLDRLFDGNGHTISNLNLNGALFDDNNGWIKNLHITNSTFINNQGGSVASLAQHNSGRIENCIVSNSSISGYDAAGIAAQSNQNDRIIDTYIINSEIHSESYSPYAISREYSGTNCYAYSCNFTGHDIMHNYNTLNASASLPTASYFQQNINRIDLSAAGSTYYDSASGVEYTVVRSASDLETALMDRNNIILGADIDGSTLGTFGIDNIIFEGNGYTVSGASFMGVNGSTVRNLGISGVTNRSTVFGNRIGESTISNCFILNSTMTKAGFTEDAWDSTIEYCTLAGCSISSNSDGSGIAKNVYGSTINNCKVLCSEISANQQAAGIAMNCNGPSTISNNSVIGSTINSTRASGIIGSADGGIVQNNNVYDSLIYAGHRDVSEHYDYMQGTLSGIAGDINSTVFSNNNVFNTSIIANNGQIAGIVQDSTDSSISNCGIYDSTIEFTDTMQDSRVSGIVGYFNASSSSHNLSYCTVKASITDLDNENSYSAKFIGKLNNRSSGVNILNNCKYDSCMTVPANDVNIEHYGSEYTTLSSLGMTSNKYITIHNPSTNDNIIVTVKPSDTLDDISTNIKSKSNYEIFTFYSYENQNIQNIELNIKQWYNQCYITGMDSQLANILHLNVGEGYTYQISNIETHSNTNSNTQYATGTTTLSTANSTSLSMADLGLGSNGTITTNNYVVTVNTTDMMSEVLAKLGSAGITASINDSNGTLQLIGSADDYITAASNNLKNLLGLTTGSGYTYNTNTITTRADSTSRAQNYTRTYTVQETATENTRLNALTGGSLTAGNLVFSTSDGAKTIKVDSDETIKSLRKKLANNGITTDFTDGKFTLSANKGDLTISDSTSNVASLMGLTYNSTLDNFSTSNNINALADDIYEEQNSQPSTIGIQVGINGNAEDVITIDTSMKLGRATLSALSSESAVESLDIIDNMLNLITSKQTEFAAASNRLESATETIMTYMENLTSSLSTIRDADIAKESSNYIKAQILQQASATLLATANQTPAIALQLL